MLLINVDDRLVSDRYGPAPLALHQDILYSDIETVRSVILDWSLFVEVGG